MTEVLDLPLTVHTPPVPCTWQYPEHIPHDHCTWICQGSRRTGMVLPLH